MCPLLGFVNMLLQPNSCITTSIEILLINLSTVVFIHMPTIEHDFYIAAFGFLHSCAHVNIEPIIERCTHILEIVK